MLDEKKSALHISSPLGTHPSLLPLRMALIAAESGSPSRPPRMDVNEQRALQLIEKVKAGYKKQQFVLRWEDVPSPYGFHVSHRTMVNSHA
ncbi:MAG: hypothetical protein ABI904_12265 [Chloroflexota bacterium]